MMKNIYENSAGVSACGNVFDIVEQNFLPRRLLIFETYKTLCEKLPAKIRVWVHVCLCVFLYHHPSINELKHLLVYQ
jgi:hypothetical protein